jgi:hypothetical protein
LAGFGTFLYSILSSYMVPLFLLNKVTLSERTKRIIRIVLTIVLFLGLALILWAQFTGRLVQIDESGMYPLGGMYYSAYMMTAVYMIFDLPLLILYGDEIVPKQRLTLGIFIIMPLIATLGKPLYSEVHLATLFTSISLLLMVIMIVDEDAKAFRQQEVLKEQLEIDLLLSQIQPHFLFNVLYVIQEICYIDPIKAASAIEDFSMYLRHNMDSISIRTPIPFKETGRARAANTTGAARSTTESGTSRPSARASIQITPTRATCTSSARSPTATSTPRWER